MSISSPVMPSAFISAQALPLVASPVAKPGMVKPRMVERGRPSKSQALAATISAWVEFEPARDADDEMLAAGRLEAPGEALDLDVERLVAILVELLGPVGHVGEAAQRPARSRCRRSSGSCSKRDAAEARLGMAGGDGHCR